MLSPMHLHASCHTFHHAKACIIYLCVVHTWVKRFALTNLWMSVIIQWCSCWSSVGEGASISGDAIKSNSMISLWNWLSLQHRQASEHLNLPCVLQIFISLEYMISCIRWLGLTWLPIVAWLSLIFSISSLLPILWKYLVMLGHSWWDRFWVKIYRNGLFWHNLNGE
jgi:hypothetical protein